MNEENYSPDAVVGKAGELERYSPEEMVFTNTPYRYIDDGTLMTRNINLD